MAPTLSAGANPTLLGVLDRVSPPKRSEAKTGDGPRARPILAPHARAHNRESVMIDAQHARAHNLV
jgi:hypothetical protein